MATKLLAAVENIDRRGAIDLRASAIDWRAGATLILDCLIAFVTVVPVD